MGARHPIRAEVQYSSSHSIILGGLGYLERIASLERVRSFWDRTGQGSARPAGSSHLPTMQQSALEALFLEHLPIIHRVAAAVAGRNGLRGDEVPELASWIVSRLVEDDYAALRKFRGESSLATYLTVVVTMLARDYRIQRWGRWRPSAAARRSGDIAVRLETLVYGRGYTLRQAGELMRTTGATQLTDRELAGLIAQLPSREPLRPVEVGIGTLAALAAPDGADISRRATG